MGERCFLGMITLDNILYNFMSCHGMSVHKQHRKLHVCDYVQVLLITESNEYLSSRKKYNAVYLEGRGDNKSGQCRTVEARSDLKVAPDWTIEAPTCECWTTCSCYSMGLSINGCTPQSFRKRKHEETILKIVGTHGYTIHGQTRTRQAVTA